MILRPAERADLEAVGAIWNAIIRETLITFNAVEKTPEDMAALWQDRRQSGHGFFVAELDGEIAGFAVAGPFRNGVGYRHTAEHTIQLTEVARGRGVGRALMAKLEDHSRTHQIHSLFAGVSSANPDGRAFHAALGYREICTLPEVGYKWGRWLDLHLMQKLL